MCGIVGYIGKKQAAPILLEGLSKLEYRGYDSAGIAVADGSGNFNVEKCSGRLKILIEKTDGGKRVKGVCGIGHTRWATHGMPNYQNAHPHNSADGSITIVHNGIIENYAEIKRKLEKSGYLFYSQTDTEVIVNLIDYYYKKYKSGPVDAISRFMNRARGSYAIAAMFEGIENKIYAAKKESPLILGIGKNEFFLASDVPAVLKYTKNVLYVDNGEIAEITSNEIKLFDIDKNIVSKDPVEIDMDISAAEKGGWEHFMIKEIHEQPKAVQDTLRSYLDSDTIDLSDTGIEENVIKKFRDITIVGCGSAFHVGVTLQYIFEELLKIPVRVEMASEFRYRNPLIGSDSLVLAISQSGETADTIAAVKEANKRGAITLSILNVWGSTIARESDFVMYTKAGPEIAVATTKAYSAQLICGYLLALKFAQIRKKIDCAKLNRYLSELKLLPEKIGLILNNKAQIQRYAAERSNVSDVFIIGRGIDYSIGLEGALKLKEISYIHTEAFAAGELKHGTISLIEHGTLVVGILTGENLLEKTKSNMQETLSRGATLFGITLEKYASKTEEISERIFIPDTCEIFAASLAIVPLQLLSYYISVQRGNDVDKPRNLAKSVTVE